MCLWEGAVKEEMFPHTRKHWQKWRGSFRATEESTATRGAENKAKQRDPHTEDQC